jgi:hypothetical protein
MTNEDGFSFDLTWPQVVERCGQLGVEVVKEIANSQNVNQYLTGPGMEKTEGEYLNDLVESLTDGDSLYDRTHMREGVVVRADYGEPTPIFLKNKSHAFLICEGHTKDREEYVDMEEVS